MFGEKTAFDQEQMNDILRNLYGFVYDREYSQEEPAMTPENTIKCLTYIVECFGTMRYEVNYILDKFVEYYYAEGLEEQLNAVLEERLLLNPARARLTGNMKQLDIAFTAYYALSLVYKKDQNMEALRNLADENKSKYYKAFQSYPLFYEVRSRYYKRVERYRDALIADELALRKLEYDQVENYGVMISYASTVCTVLEKGESLSRNKIEQAKSYIQKAINYNPNYAKYHYLKGRLLFVSNLNLQDLGQFKEARKCISTALERLDMKSEHLWEDTTKYNELSHELDEWISWIEQRDECFDELDEEQVRRNKREIMASEHPKTCGPKVPRLKRGNKYLFICYCSADYQSVYCDLVELYRRKVPFQYDETLNVGIDWSEQVSEKMRDPDCVGALFFISKSTVLSEGVEREIRFILDKQKQSAEQRPLYFAVNLEGRTHPLDIFFEVMMTTEKEKLYRYHVDDSRIITFFQAFPDKVPFTSKQGGPESADHMESLYQSIRKTFPELKLPEKPVM